MIVNRELVKVQNNPFYPPKELDTLEREPAWKLAPLAVEKQVGGLALPGLAPTGIPPFLPDEPSVGSILQDLHAAPYAALLVGLRSNGRPCFLDLARAESHPVLVTGDGAVGKTHQLQVMVESAIRLSLPHETEIAVIASRPAEWDEFFQALPQSRLQIDLYGWDDPAVNDKIRLLARRAEDRTNGQGSGPYVLLVLDDLTGLQVLDFAAQAGLRRLLLEGPQTRIFPLASLEAGKAALLPFWVKPFRTRLIGRIDSPRLAQVMAPDQDSPVTDLISGFEFCVFSKGSWHIHQLPVTGD
jgi:hypothetical protein